MFVMNKGVEEVPKACPFHAFNPARSGSCLSRASVSHPSSCEMGHWAQHLLGGFYSEWCLGNNLRGLKTASIHVLSQDRHGAGTWSNTYFSSGSSSGEVFLVSFGGTRIKSVRKMPTSLPEAETHI